MVESPAGQGRSEHEKARQAGFLHLSCLRFRIVEGTGQPVFSYAVPEVRLTDGSQVRQRGMTVTSP
jgi:hypothetical protein